MNVIKTEITAIRDKFADERRTELTTLEGEIDVADLIQEEDMVVTLTHAGYVKRIAKSTYRAQHRGGKGIMAMTTKEEDYAERMVVVSTHDDLMFFTNLGRVYQIKCYQIPEAGRTARGTAMVNILQISGGEKVTNMIPVPADTSGLSLVMATRGGMIKKTPMSEFQNLRKNGLIAIVLKEEDELVNVALTRGNDEILMGTRNGMCIRFSEEHIRTCGRVSMGVKAIRLEEGDYVIDMARIEENSQVLVITAKGYGKRTPCSEYREQARNGKGIRAMMVTDKTGPLAAQLLVQPEEDILLITGDGTIIRARVADIRLSGRNTQGVRIMRIAEGSEVVAVARSEAEEDDLPEESDASVSEAPQAEEAPAQADSDLDMDIPETTDTPEDEL